MERRAFLGALASGGAITLAGCTAQRETMSRVSATPEIPNGEFFHEPLRLDGPGEQFNLRYEVTADEPFDAFLFGGQSDPEEFGVYRRAVAAGGDGSPPGGGGCVGRVSGPPEGRPRSGSGHGSGNRPPGGDPGAGGGGSGAVDCPEPSGWHSVVGARGRGTVNRPLGPGIHHFVVDNTHLGAATPNGTLRPTIDLTVRDFELFSG